MFLIKLFSWTYDDHLKVIKNVHELNKELGAYAAL